MRQVRFNVQRDAVPTHPSGDADADGADLGLHAGRRIGHPDADAAVPALALDVEAVEGADQPFLQPVNVASDVLGGDAAMGTGQVEHDVGCALARAVICPLAAAASLEGRETGGIGQFSGLAEVPAV